MLVRGLALVRRLLLIGRLGFADFGLLFVPGLLLVDGLLFVRGRLFIRVQIRQQDIILLQNRRFYVVAFDGQLYLFCRRHVLCDHVKRILRKRDALHGQGEQCRDQ